MNWSLVTVLIAWPIIVASQDQGYCRGEPSRCELTPIQLAEVVNDIVVVNDDALSNLMKRKELEGKPLVILSIVGEYRTGKSFIMNLVLRYLRNNGWENKKWFYDETWIGEDFEHKRGINVVTQGMVVHPEIFQIPLEDGRQAAVILVDTQGLYDDNTSPDCNAKLEALSVLFSSHQLVNIKEKIKSVELESLQVCIEIAKEAANYSKNKTEPLQTLTFLIRDWNNENQYPFGVSTDGYLAQYMIKNSTSPILKKVKDYIHKAFSKVECYLLPHPGEGVAKSVEKLKNSDMSEEFQLQAKLFVEYIFNPKNIYLKRNVNGDLATARDMLNMIGSMGKKFGDQEFYKTKTAYEVMRRGHLNGEITESVSTYKTKMEEICLNHLVMANKELSKWHEEIFRSTKKRFEESNKFESDKEMLEEFLEQLKKECNIVYTTLASVNLAKKNELLNEARRAKRKLTKSHRELAETGTSLSTTEREFDLLLKNAIREGLDSFDDKFVKVKKALGEEFSAIRKDLDSDIEEAFNKRKNALQREKLIRDKKTAASKQQALILTNKFQLECDQYTDQYHEDLETKLTKIKEEMLTKYNKEMEGNSEGVLQNGKQLKLDLDGMIALSEKKNSKNKDDAEKRTKESGQILALYLEKSLEENMRNNYIKPTRLDEVIKGYMNEVDDILASQPPWTRPIVKRIMEDKAKYLRNRNEHNKKYRSLWKDIHPLILRILESIGETVSPVIKEHPFGDTLIDSARELYKALKKLL